MSLKILLNVSARRVTMALFSQRRLSEVKSFPNDPSASSAFLRLVAAHERTPVYLMADVVEEDFRAETLPHVMGRARHEMVARKLAQFFRTAPYRAAWLQGRTADRRRDDQYLFLALNSSDLLRPYLEIIEARRAPLAGIYLLPVVSQALVERLKPSTAGVLLVSFQGGGLRQSFFVHGKLRISRLTPFEHAPEQTSPQTMLHLLTDEIEKSRLFLYNARLFSRDAPLQAWVLDPTGALHATCAELASEPNFRCDALGRDVLAKAFGLPAADLPQDMDALLLCLLGRHPPECSLALPRQTRGFTYHQLRHATYGLAASLAAIAVAWSGYNLYARSSYADRAVVARADAARVQRQYEDAAHGFPAAPTSAENMRAAVDAVNAMRAHARTPEREMLVVGRVLTAYPNVHLTRLAWRYGTEKETADATDAGFQGWEETGELSAEIRPFDGDYRAALRLIEHLAQSLRGQAGVADVRVLELPVNLDPKAGLSGNTSDAPDAASAVAQFRLAIRFGRPA